MKLLAKWGWLGLVAFGLILVISGLFMIYQGKSAHDEVADALSEERIVGSQGTDIADVKVTGPDEAKTQADKIKQDVLNMTGGKTYAELDRNDPNRNTYLTSITLRTALMQSYMAFKVADLVMGVGALVAVLGLAQAVLGLYLGFVVVKRSQPSVGATVLTEPPSHVSPPTGAWTGTGRSPQPR